MIPFVIFGLFAGLASALMVTLPETLNAPLPTTLEEAEDYKEFIEKRKFERNQRAANRC